MQPWTKRSFLKGAGLAIAHRIAAPAAEPMDTGRRVIIVTFGGGVRNSETFAPEGLVNIPRLAALQPQGVFYSNARNEGVLSHFNSTSSIATGQWQRVDDFGFQPPASPTIFEHYRRARRAPATDAWVVATNKSFASMGASALRDFGAPFGANVVLPKQLLLEAVKDLAQRPGDGGMANRDLVEKRLASILDEGYEGVGWTIFKGGRSLTRSVRNTLTQGLAAFINGPEAPSSGDELTYFITREIMREFAPRLMLVNFWDMDVAHWGSYSLYLQAITRTDRLTGMLWDEVQANPKYRNKTTLLILPELGRDGDFDTANGFLNHRSGDASCRGVWMLALGAGLAKGVVERPVTHIDIAATALNMLGVQSNEMTGKPLREILV
jgi:hypothetical protein